MVINGNNLTLQNCIKQINPTHPTNDNITFEVSVTVMGTSYLYNITTKLEWNTTISQQIVL